MTEGDPSVVGTRTGGGVRSRTGLVLRVGGDLSLPADRLPAAVGDVAAEFAVQLLNDVRALPF